MIAVMLFAIFIRPFRPTCAEAGGRTGSNRRNRAALGESSCRTEVSITLPQEELLMKESRDD